MTDASPASPTSPTAAPAERRAARCTIDQEAIAANWSFFRKLAPESECAAVIKADAYGLGARETARTLAKAGCRTFFTATAGEGADARAALGDGPKIYVLNGPSAAELGTFRQAALTPVINTLAQAHLWAGPCALHVDTGMNRLGLPMPEVGAAAASLPEVELVMSHLAFGFDSQHAMNARQRARFLAAAAAFPGARKSLAATAGAQLGGAYHFDMTRIGVGLYGSPDRDDGAALQQAARIEAPILQIRDVAAGETFGYAGTFTAPQRMRTATVAIGYADGFLRSLAGRGYGVLAGGRRPVLGRVSMDMVILDVSECPQARVGDLVQFLGPEAPVDEVGRLAGTNGYEILTTLVGTVRRAGGARA